MVLFIASQTIGASAAAQRRHFGYILETETVVLPPINTHTNTTLLTLALECRQIPDLSMAHVSGGGGGG